MTAAAPTTRKRQTLRTSAEGAGHAPDARETPPPSRIRDSAAFESLPESVELEDRTHAAPWPTRRVLVVAVDREAATATLCIQGQPPIRAHLTTGEVEQRLKGQPKKWARTRWYLTDADRMALLGFSAADIAAVDAAADAMACTQRELGVSERQRRTRRTIDAPREGIARTVRATGEGDGPGATSECGPVVDPPDDDRHWQQPLRAARAGGT